MFDSFLSSSAKCIQVRSQIPGDRSRRERRQLHHPPSRGEVANYSVASDRVERILRTFLCCENEVGPTKNVTPYRGRILAYAQDFDGEIEGPSHFILRIATLTSAFIWADRQTTGDPRRVCYYLPMKILSLQ
jgi:hypothetical protein